METCFICNKHKGIEAIPPGGYIYEDELWAICHAPINVGPLGTIFIESKRHFLDFAEFNSEEQRSYGIVASKVSAALKQLTDATRIYHLSMVEGIPHFHVWLIPRRKDVEETSLAFLSRNDSCSEEDAIAFANQLRDLLK
jgi:diadenosine tetraphosphate (Ap4A) HIT family hydrolase